jgi:hypothetical protein
MNLLHLLDDAKCFEVIQAHRWPEGVWCLHCHADQIAKQGRDEHQRARQRYRCLGREQKFNDHKGRGRTRVGTEFPAKPVEAFCPAGVYPNLTSGHAPENASLGLIFAFPDTTLSRSQSPT